MDQEYVLHVSDTYHELREHGDVAFPLGDYQTTERSHDAPWHWHEEYELSVMQKGEVPFSVGTDNITLKEGDVIFINTGILHAQSTSQASGTFCKRDIVFHGRLIYGSKYSVFWHRYVAPVAKAGVTLPYLHLRRDVPWEAAAIRHALEVLRLVEERPGGYEFDIRYHLSKIFVLISENIQRLEQIRDAENFQELLHAKKMLGFIQENYPENITLKDLARCSSLCEREVQRTFQNIIHQSPIQYLIQYRIEKACQMLDSGESSIIEISNSCGFSSPSYFSKTFKKLIGCQPREYRKTR